MTVKDAEQQISEQLKTIYDNGETAGITKWVIEYITGINRTKLSQAGKNLFTPSQSDQLNLIISRLMQYEPIQYVVNQSWFCGLKFYVDKNVLIPRPETEELLEWIITNCKFPVDELKILDIGSGSGCVPVSLKRRLKKAEVRSCDISDEALTIANRNAVTLGTEVNFIKLDFLDHDARNQLPSFDIIVSNPPYVPEKDKETMNPNVLQYEPAAALFVPDNDPLVFYKAIAEFGKEHLNPAGSIYCEIYEAFGEEVVSIFNSYGYSTELRKDMQQKDRMIKAAIL